MGPTPAHFVFLVLRGVREHFKGSRNLSRVPLVREDREHDEQMTNANTTLSHVLVFARLYV